MRNPWRHDPDEVPDDAGVRPRSGRLETAGYVLWALVVGTVALGVILDPGEAVSDHGVALVGLGVVTVVLAVVFGIVASLLVRYTSAFGARLVGFGLTLLLLAALPYLVPLLVDHVDLFGQLPVDIPDGVPVFDRESAGLR